MGEGAVPQNKTRLYNLPRRFISFQFKFQWHLQLFNIRKVDCIVDLVRVLWHDLCFFRSQILQDGGRESSVAAKDCFPVTTLKRFDRNEKNVRMFSFLSTVM